MYKNTKIVIWVWHLTWSQGATASNRSSPGCCDGTCGSGNTWGEDLLNTWPRPGIPTWPRHSHLGQYLEIPGVNPLWCLLEQFCEGCLHCLYWIKATIYHIFGFLGIRFVSPQKRNCMFSSGCHPPAGAEIWASRGGLLLAAGCADDLGGDTAAPFDPVLLLFGRFFARCSLFARLSVRCSRSRRSCCSCRSCLFFRLSRRRQVAIYPGCCWPTSHLSCSSLLRRRPSVNWLASPRSPLIAQVQPLQSQEVHLKALWSDHPRDNDRPVRRVSLECARGRGIWEKRNRKISSSKKVFSFQNRQKENAPPKKGSFAQIYQKKK